MGAPTDMADPSGLVVDGDEGDVGLRGEGGRAEGAEEEESGDAFHGGRLFFGLLALAFAFRLISEGLLHQRREGIGLLLPSSGEFGGFFGHLGSEIVLLGAVGFQVVEFPGLVSSSDELPVAHADGFVALVEPP